MDEQQAAGPSFFERPGVQLEKVGPGGKTLLGVERVYNPALGIGGAYGAWGNAYNNQALPGLIQERLGAPLGADEGMNLADLGFLHRHHIRPLSEAEDIELEIEAAACYVTQAAQACGWQPGEVDALLLGVSAPVQADFTEQVARRAGLPESAWKASIHKACDSSMGGLHLILNPDLHLGLGFNPAQDLAGKKVLVGGFEGLSRFLRQSRDHYGYQLFGNGAGVIGVQPGKSMRFLVGKTHEAFDEEGVLEVKMLYPHAGIGKPGQSLVEVSQVSGNHARLAGLMHEPPDGSSLIMAGPMGMVKLFVRTGVQVVKEVYEAYQEKMAQAGGSSKGLAVAVVHHANYKINKLIEKNLQREGISIPMPWLLSEFGNVSAASNMIAFLRTLPGLKPGDHVLFDGFGAGTYYDTFAVEMGG